MPNNIFHKRSLTPGSVPTTSSLNVGEIAINVPDGKIFVEKSGSAGQSVETVLVSNTTTDIGVLTLSGSLILSGSGTGSVLDVSAGNIDFDFDTLSFSGSASITGSLRVTGGITGSLQGTSSYATTALSSSYALTASYALNGGGGGGASGIFGISNSSGVYTYYTTLTLAMTAASSGQVIEMFADVTETGAVSVTLKTGVNINGNGHTYTLSNSGTANALIDNNVAVSCEIFNIKIVRTLGATPSNVANMCLSIFSTTSEIKCSNAFFKNTNGTSILNLGNLWGVSAVSTNGTIGTIYSGGNIYDSYVESTNSNALFGNVGNIVNCTGIANTSGIGINMNAGNVYNSFGKSTSGNGLSGGGKFYNSIAVSTTGNAIDVGSGAELNQCTGISTSGFGIIGNGHLAYQCRFISSSNYGAGAGQSAEHYDCSHESTSNVAVFGYVGLKLYRGVTYSKWNNAGGHAFQQWSSGNSSVLNNVFLRVTNTSANCINSGGVAATISYSHNSYLGATTPISSFITQTLTNTEDNQGNIKL